MVYTSIFRKTNSRQPILQSTVAFSAAAPMFTRPVAACALMQRSQGAASWVVALPLTDARHGRLRQTRLTRLSRYVPDPDDPQLYCTQPDPEDPETPDFLFIS